MTFRKTFAARWRALAVILVALLTTLGLLCISSASEADDAPAPPEPTIVRADQKRIVLEWRAPDFALRLERGADGRPYTIVEAPGWEQSGAPGDPQLPLASALTVVPPADDVSLHVQVLEQEQRTLSHPVKPAPRMEIVGDPPIGLEPAWARDERVYGNSKKIIIPSGLRNVANNAQNRTLNGSSLGFSHFGPENFGLELSLLVHRWESYSSGKAYVRVKSSTVNVITLEDAGWVRGRRLVRLTFRPMRYDPMEKTLEITRRVRAELRFADRATAATEWAADDAFTPILQRTVVNPEQVIPFARPGRRPTASAAKGQPLDAQAAPTDTEYLIITHSDFVTAVAPLAQQRAISDGLKVFSTTTQAIYDAYSGGEVSAPAIGDYISATYHAPAAPALDYVLLVGDGSEDGSGGQYIPPYTITMKPGDPPWWDEDWVSQTVAIDNYFAAVDGPDNMPDVFLGRLPVNTLTETETIVGKILSYEQNPLQYPWNERALFFAGNEEDPDTPDPPETFHEDSDSVYATLPVTFTGRRVYLCAYDCNDPHEYEAITTAHDLTLAQLNVGGLLSSYVGHSSWHQWAVDPETFAPMFHLSDVANLHNDGALPVFLEMTCYTSRFAYPEGDTLDEELLRHVGGGAAATWGSTALGCTGGHNVLHHEFYNAVFEEGTTKLGAATWKAKLALFEGGDPDYQDLLDTFVLLGDPAMKLNLTIVPWSDELFLPLVMRGE